MDQSGASVFWRNEAVVCRSGGVRVVAVLMPVVSCSMQAPMETSTTQSSQLSDSQPTQQAMYAAHTAKSLRFRLRINCLDVS